MEEQTPTGMLLANSIELVRVPHPEVPKASAIMVKIDTNGGVLVIDAKQFCEVAKETIEQFEKMVGGAPTLEPPSIIDPRNN